MVARFAPTVHGPGDHGFVAVLVGVAREKGVAGYVGDGANRWPAVHRLDAGRLVRLAVERAPAGSVVHATAEEGIPTRDDRRGDRPRRSASPSRRSRPRAAEHFGWLGRVLRRRRPGLERAHPRALLGWEPTHPGLIEDIPCA